MIITSKNGNVITGKSTKFESLPVNGSAIFLKREIVLGFKYKRDGAWFVVETKSVNKKKTDEEKENIEYNKKVAQLNSCKKFCRKCVKFEYDYVYVASTHNSTSTDTHLSKHTKEEQDQEDQEDQEEQGEQEDTTTSSESVTPKRSGRTSNSNTPLAMKNSKSHATEKSSKKRMTTTEKNTLIDDAIKSKTFLKKKDFKRIRFIPQNGSQDKFIKLLENIKYRYSISGCWVYDGNSALYREIYKYIHHKEFAAGEKVRHIILCELSHDIAHVSTGHILCCNPGHLTLGNHTDNSIDTSEREELESNEMYKELARKFRGDVMSIYDLLGKGNTPADNNALETGSKLHYDCSDDEYDAGDDSDVGDNGDDAGDDNGGDDAGDDSDVKEVGNLFDKLELGIFEDFKVKLWNEIINDDDNEDDEDEERQSFENWVSHYHYADIKQIDEDYALEELHRKYKEYKYKHYN